MSAYLIADITVTDAEKMAQYREWSTRAMQEHGAEVLVRGGDFDILEGAWTPSRLVVLKFDSWQGPPVELVVQLRWRKRVSRHHYRSGGTILGVLAPE